MTDPLRYGLGRPQLFRHAHRTNPVGDDDGLGPGTCSALHSIVCQVSLTQTPHHRTGQAGRGLCGWAARRMIIVGVCCAVQLLQGQGCSSALGTNTARAGLCPPTDSDPSRAILGKVAMRISTRSASERDKFWSGGDGTISKGLDHHHRTRTVSLPATRSADWE